MYTYNLLTSLSTAEQWVEINSKVELSLGYKRVQKYLEHFNVQVEKNNMKSIRKATSENISPHCVLWPLEKLQQQHPKELLCKGKPSP